MNEENKKKIDNLETFGKQADVHPSLPIFSELQTANGYLKIIAEKEVAEMPEFPEIPEPKEVDMTETNDLLQQLLAKETTENEPIEVTVELIIT